MFLGVFERSRGGWYRDYPPKRGVGPEDPGGGPRDLQKNRVQFLRIGVQFLHIFDEFLMFLRCFWRGIAEKPITSKNTLDEGEKGDKNGSVFDDFGGGFEGF